MSEPRHTDIDPEQQPQGEAETEAGARAAEAKEASETEEQPIEEALAQAERDAADAREAMLRMHADMENLRKRLHREQEKSRQFALERIMNDLLPVLDSFEHGLRAAEENPTVESLREGKALIKRMLEKVVADHGLGVVDPVGEPFDPEFHEAMTMQPSDEVAEGTVLEVLQKGYQLNGRLIRPARVVVSSG